MGKRAKKRTKKPDTFVKNLRELTRRRLDREIDYPTFLKELLDLHFHHGRRGFNREDYDRELKLWKARPANP